MRVVALLLLVLASASAFVPMAAPRVTRQSGVMMSHFSTIKTQLKDKTTLVKTLKELGMPVVTAEEPQIVHGYQGGKVEADMVINQNNGKGVGFRMNPVTQSYELVADLQFWDQSVSVERFMQKLNQQYSVNSVMQSGSEDGFQVEEMVKNEVDGTVKLTLARWTQ